MAWTKGSNVVFSNLGQEQFLDALSELLPFDIFVTSGSRTPAAQVQAMYTKLELGGRQELLDTYRDDDFATAVADAYPDVDTGIEVVERYNPSSHGTGNAIDLRTRDKTSLQLGQMQEAIQTLGGSSLYESVPPHLHVEIPADFSRSTQIPADSTVSPSTKKNIWPLVGLGFLVLFLIQRNQA